MFLFPVNLGPWMLWSWANRDPWSQMRHLCMKETWKRSAATMLSDSSAYYCKNRIFQHRCPTLFRFYFTLQTSSVCHTYSGLSYYVKQFFLYNSINDFVALCVLWDCNFQPHCFEGACVCRHKHSSAQKAITKHINYGCALLKVNEIKVPWWFLLCNCKICQYSWEQMFFIAPF